MKTKYGWAVAVLAMAVTVAVALIVVLQPPVKKSAVEPVKESVPVAQPQVDRSADAVAKIGDYVITRGQLEERLVRAIQPREAEYAEEIKPVTAEAILREMLAEKAMSMEGRQLGYLNDEAIHQRIEELQQGRLAMMVQESLFPEPPSVDAAEVDRLMKERPQLSREQATSFAQRAAGMKIFEQFHSKLVEKFHLKKVQSSFAQAAQIHQRLLERPVTPRGPGEYWIRNSQVRDELSEKDKNLVLATYDGGQYTLKDWFNVICNMAPPRRPGDLSTPAGVERLLDLALRAPILVAEAKVRGYDKDEKLRADIRQREDQELLSKLQEEKTKGVGEPAPEQVKAYFEKNQERFAQPAAVKISQIWCENLQAAQGLQATLDKGEDFETARKAHSIQKEEEPHNVSAIGEGLFWAELWKADPGQMIGPMRGFYSSGVKWRIVKILEKTPAKVQPYSEQVANSVKWAMMGEQRQRVLEDCRTELLAKYPHEIFGDKMQDMDPLEIAMSKGNK
jgi:hypothetical protein